MKLFKCDLCWKNYSEPLVIYYGGVSLDHYSASITHHIIKEYETEGSSVKLDLCQNCQNELDNLVSKFIERKYAE